MQLCCLTSAGVHTQALTFSRSRSAAAAAAAAAVSAALRPFLRQPPHEVVGVRLPLPPRGVHPDGVVRLFVVAVDLRFGVFDRGGGTAGRVRRKLKSA